MEMNVVTAVLAVMRVSLRRLFHQRLETWDSQFEGASLEQGFAVIADVGS